MIAAVFGFVLVAASGWWGRYEAPILTGLGAAAVYAATPYSFPIVEGTVAGLIFAYMRRSVVPQSRLD